MLQGLGDQPVERLGSVAGKVPVQRTVHLADIGRAIDDQRAVFLRVDVGAAQGILIAEFADDLFENVLERDDAANVAVLVHDDADPALLFLEVQQLGGKRRVFRHEVGLGTRGKQAFLGQLVVTEQAGDLSHVDDALDLVDVVAEHRQTRVRSGAQLADDRFQIVIEVDTGDLVARNHDVVDRHSFQVENAQQHALAIEGQVATRFAHHAAQFLGGQAVIALVGQVDAEQPEQAVAHPAEHGDQGVEHLLQHLQWQTDRVGDDLRAQRRQRLGCDLTEYQQDDRQADGCDGDACFAPQLHRQHRGNG